MNAHEREIVERVEKDWLAWKWCFFIMNLNKIMSSRKPASSKEFPHRHHQRIYTHKRGDRRWLFIMQIMLSELGKNDILKFPSHDTMRLDSQFFVCEYHSRVEKYENKKIAFSLTCWCFWLLWASERERQKKHINQKLFNGIYWLNVCFLLALLMIFFLALIFPPLTHQWMWFRVKKTRKYSIYCDIT